MPNNYLMIDNFLNKNPGDSFYFQLYPLSLSIIGQESVLPDPSTTYKFSVLKGTNQFS
jgi:hypothetical protein